jgi:CRISPR-associated endonuclease Csn1
MAKKYLMGLDLGTDSVGWCVTDENNQIVRKGGKSLWGVRLFEEANDCSSRRMSRESRRRIIRRMQRIDLLQTIFAPEMNKVDPTFFIRMNNSFYLEKDKAKEAQGTDGTLFAGVGGLTDKGFYQQFPTIYHLRKSLIEGNEKADIRLLYLALHHMVKYRGNFLHYGEEINVQGVEELTQSFAQIDQALSAMGKSPFHFEEKKIAAYVSLAQSAHGISDAKRAFADFFGSEDPYIKNVLCPLLAGSKVATAKIYGLDDDEESDPKAICVRDASFDDDFAKLSESYASRGETTIIQAAKAISDFVLLKRLLGSSHSLSEAMVSRYELHKKDLAALKKYVRAHCPEKFDKIFVTYSPDVANYVRYIGMSEVKGKRFRYEHCHREEFYAFLKKEVFAIDKKVTPSDPAIIDILSRMDNGDYLPRQNSTDNGVFPYQLNLTEMKTILQKQKAFYPFLELKDQEGYTGIEKIESILTYHIPYYVGPLMNQKAGDPRSSHAWVVRSEEKITPWNFRKEGLIDFDQSAQNFIQRMLNKCTYLPDCYCLPKSSLLYSRYEVISFLNNIAINGKSIPAHSDGSGDVSKDELLAGVFARGNVSKAGLVSYLRSRYGKFDPSLLTFRSGKPIDTVDASLKSYADFVGILGHDYVEKHLDQIESIINDLSIFTEKSIVERRLRKLYGFTDEKSIRQIKGLSYSGFGRLSKELLLLKSDHLQQDTGEIVPITLIDAMYETGENLMEIINDPRFSYAQQINSRREEYAPAIKADAPKLEQVKAAVDELYVSPSLKRPLLQAYEIIDEVNRLLPEPVSEYYVECTRGENAKEKGHKKPSRLENLLHLYAVARSEATKLLNDIDAKEESSLAEQELKKQILQNKDNLERCYQDLAQDSAQGAVMKFRSDKLYFYYTQLGRCMYSLKPIDLSALSADQQMYDVDHIVPQSLTKDDSIENRVLVLQDYNRKKTDKYPLPSDFLAPGAKSFYRYLYRIGLIGERKLAALTRASGDELSEEELASFTNRQLVSTNQAVIGLINIIQKFEKAGDKTPEVIYSKANLVSDFRSQFDLLKSRDANDFHHAHDAYLNIIVGRANHEYFRYMKGKGWFAGMHQNHQTTNPDRIFDTLSEEAKAKGYHKDPIKDPQGNICWDYAHSLAQIEKDIYHRFDVMVTVRQFVQPGLFNKVSIHKKSDWKGGNLFPLKKGLNPADYGGYCDLTNGFFALLEILDKKGKSNATLLPIPNIYADKDHPDKILAYAKDVAGVKANKVLIPCLRINTVIRKGAVCVLLSGKHTNTDTICKNMTEMRFSKDEIRTIRSISKIVEIVKNNRKYGLDPAKGDFDQKLHILLGVVPEQARLIISPAANEKRNKPLVLSRQDEENLYQIICQKLNSKFFEGMGGPANTGAFMEKPEVRAKFASLSVAMRALALNELLTETSANSAELGSLSILGGPGLISIRHMGNVLAKGTQIVAQSVTGFYDKVLWEVK